jgi:SLT domain-containing protein
MAGKLSFLVGLGAGYVLGTRSGRERYDQIAAKAQDWWRSPSVQEKAGQAQELVREKADLAGQRLKEKATSASPADGGTS